MHALDGFGHDLYHGTRDALLYGGQQLNKDGAAGRLRDLVHRGWLTGHRAADSDNSDNDERGAKAASQEGSSQEVAIDLALNGQDESAVAYYGPASCKSKREAYIYSNMVLDAAESRL